MVKTQWQHEKREKTASQKTSCRYLALVPVLHFLLVLLCYFVILAADLLNDIRQVRILGFNLHLHLRVLDLLTQVVHHLQE